MRIGIITLWVLPFHYLPGIHIERSFNAPGRDAIAMDAMPFDLIVQQTGYSAGSVSSALLQLELLGLVSQLPGMHYQRC